jgi:UDP-N-acetylglucosamine 2-epimerase
MKKIVTIVGARPQFIKSNILSKEITKKFNEILVHTGQHYDVNMSDIFFIELEMKTPDYNLGIGSDTHAKQTAKMMVKIEEVLEKEKPDGVLLYGDTNSTLAGALVAAKLLIPIFHVEGGVRTYCKYLPEEQNRVLTDHVSSLIFVSSESNMDDARKEGLGKISYKVGDIMYDSLLHYTEKIKNYSLEEMFSKVKPLYSNIKKMDKYYLFTLHRPENTDKIEHFDTILNAVNKLKYPVLFPVHPRIRKYVDSIHHKYNNIRYIEPLSYLETLYFTKYAEKVVTDSGGLHKEAYLHGVPCVTILEGGWSETNHGGWNHFVEPTEEAILHAVNDYNIDWEDPRNEFGDGQACKKIVEIIANYLEESSKC